MDKLQLTNMVNWPGCYITIERLMDGYFVVDVGNYNGRYAFEHGKDLMVFLVNNLFLDSEREEIKEALGVEYGSDDMV